MVANIFKVTLATTALLASGCAKTDTTAAVEKTAGALAANAQATENERTARGGNICLLYTSPSPRDGLLSRMPSSA